MMTLDDAWEWYGATLRQAELLGHVARKHWDTLPWEGPLGQDEKLKSIESDAIKSDARFCSEHLDDFAVLILFSVFESIVRERVLAEVEAERSRLSHALVVRIVDGAMQDIEQGSFFRILEVFKDRDADLVEEVNQVRRYRNWVAHGRRSERPAFVAPEIAYARLKRFLDAIGVSPSREPS
jgi:hypothetical protein